MRRAPLLVLWLAGAPALLAQAGEREFDDNPRLRWENFYQRRAYPFARVPEAALQRARVRALQLRAGNLLVAAPPISGTQWQPLGPSSIPWFGTSTGRASAIAVHPTNSSIVYVGGAQGGVWKTADGGASWTPLTDRECSLAMGSIALDPVNPDIVYAGTGEQHFSGDSYYGCGVLRSSDGGSTWTRLGAAELGGGRRAPAESRASSSRPGPPARRPPPRCSPPAIRGCSGPPTAAARGPKCWWERWAALR